MGFNGWLGIPQGVRAETPRSTFLDGIDFGEASCAAESGQGVDGFG